MNTLDTFIKDITFLKREKDRLQDLNEILMSWLVRIGISNLTNISGQKTQRRDFERNEYFEIVQAFKNPDIPFNIAAGGHEIKVVELYYGPKHYTQTQIKTFEQLISLFREYQKNLAQ